MKPLAPLNKGMFHVKLPDPEMNELLAGLAQEIGITLTMDESRRLLDHLSLVIEKNKVLNLTRIVDEKAGVRLHVVDSIAAFPAVVDCPDGELCDLGTGAGFPGIPLALLSGREVTLVESVKKKAAAVEEFLAPLGLSDAVNVFPGRAEELAMARPHAYACCTARALSSLTALLELSAPLLARGGRLIALKASPEEAEIAAAELAAPQVGMKPLDVVRYTLPAGDETRSLFIYEKVSEPRVKLPRRPGMAQRQPLA